MLDLWVPEGATVDGVSGAGLELGERREGEGVCQVLPTPKPILKS